MTPPVATRSGSPPAVARPGTGWTEVYMGGSPDAEHALLAELLPHVARIQETVARMQAATPRRAFHNKGIAVALRFEVSPAIPAELQAGLLRPGAVYEGFGRFSRSQSFRGRDGDIDQRGFAFRIQTDDGPQDFLQSNTPASFAADPVQFLTVAMLFAQHARPIAAVRTVLALGLREGIRVVLDLARPPDRRVTFTTQRYWSRTAFQFGDLAARLFVRPTSPARRVDGDDPDFLTTALKAELQEGSPSFELCAQLFVDERRTPIENGSRAWDESVAPPIVLGTVVIPRQDLDSPESVALAERVERSVSFSPFVTRNLRPLGRMNRVRDEAYAISAATRGAAPR